MISREDLRRLASFECRLPDEFAVSFYFQPATPQDKSHREEAIQAKDLVRNTLQELELNGRSHPVIGDLQRILKLAESLHGNQARGKAVFACSPRDLWMECDIPQEFSVTRLFVNRRFHLKPMAALMSENPKLWVALVDRQNARFLEVEFEQTKEQGALSNLVPRHGRSDGFGGYDAGHTERHLEDEVRRHFQAAAQLLKSAAERRQFEALVVGCNDINWPEFEAQLHPDVKKKLVGRFAGELTVLSNEKAAQEALRIEKESLSNHHQMLFRETLDAAWGNGRGVTGLRRVLRATEQGEVETILMSREYSARAVECTNCRHLDSHLVPYCPVCGRATRQLDDVCEALVPKVVRSNLGLVLLPPNDALNRVGNIAALLRFRADQNKNRLLAVS
jgi:peptide subunit release factor 1 (eRF1)